MAKPILPRPLSVHFSRHEIEPIGLIPERYNAAKLYGGGEGVKARSSYMYFEMYFKRTVLLICILCV